MKGLFVQLSLLISVLTWADGSIPNDLCVSAVGPEWVSGVNDFGISVLKRADPASPRADVVISPVLLSSAIQNLVTLARNGSRAGLERALGEAYREDPSTIQIALRGLLGSDSAVPFVASHALFSTRPGVEFDLGVMESTSIEHVDVALDPGAIQVWIQQTAGYDRVRLPEGDIPPDALALELSRLDLQTQIPFPPADRVERSFQGFEDEVPFLVSPSASVGFAQVETFKMITLPLGGSGRFTFDVLVPSDEVPLLTLVGDLNDRTYRQWVAKLEARQVKIEIPEFSATSIRDIAPYVESMDEAKAFGPASAYQQAGSEKPPASIGALWAHRNLSLKRGSGVTASLPVSPPQEEFVADRPFLGVVRHVETGLIMMIATIKNPLGRSN